MIGQYKEGCIKEQKDRVLSTQSDQSSDLRCHGKKSKRIEVPYRPKRSFCVGGIRVSALPTSAILYD